MPGLGLSCGLDLVLLTDAFEHLPRSLEVLRHALQLLADGGRLLLTVLAFPLLTTSHDEHDEHQARYTLGACAGERPTTE